MPRRHQNVESHHCRCKDQGPTIRGFLIPSLLFLLRDAPCHGYQLIEKLQEKGYVREMPDPGVIYRHLRHMEKDGAVTASFEAGGGPARKVYTITDMGREHLSDWISMLSDLKSALDQFLKDASP